MADGLSIGYMLGLIITLLVGIFWVWMIVDATKKKFKKKRNKVIWLLVIILTGIVGAFIYYVTEKKDMVKSNSFGSSGFTLGVLSIISLGIFGVVLSIVGFIFCLVQQMKKPTKLAKAGLIVNGAGLILSLVWIFYFSPRLDELMNQINSFPSA